MEYRRLGRSGLKVSALASGTMSFGSVTGREDAFRLVDAALEAEIKLFDCADVYAVGTANTSWGRPWRGTENARARC